MNRDLGFSMFDSFLQTDAPINHGNSGGPIFDMKGRVIGVSTAYYTGGNAKGGSIGLGFAIPAEQAQEIVGLLRTHGYLKLGWLGVDGATLTPEMANALGLKAASGAVVAEVEKGSPADGVLRTGDVITEVDGARLEDMRMLRRESAASLGKRQKLKFLRNGKAETAAITPTEWPGARAAPETPMQPMAERSGVATDLGFASAQITDEMRDRFKIDPALRGVVVTRVEPRSAAADSGLQIGDVVETAQLRPVETPADIPDRVSETLQSGRGYVALMVRSQGKWKFVSLPLNWEAPVAQVASQSGQ
jgi:serine protease Do